MTPKMIEICFLSCYNIAYSLSVCTNARPGLSVKSERQIFATIEKEKKKNSISWTNPSGKLKIFAIKRDGVGHIE